MWFNFSLIRYNAERGTLDLHFLKNISSHIATNKLWLILMLWNNTNDRYQLSLLCVSSVECRSFHKIANMKQRR
jgi:hypothetical protein